MLQIGPKQFIASLDVDTQNGFTDRCPDELPVPEGDKVVDALNTQATFSKYRIGSKDAHPATPYWLATETNPAFSEIHAKNMRHYWPKHCIPGTEGFKLVSGLPHPSDYDYYIWKGIEPDMHPYGACYHDLQEKLSTGLIEFLHHRNVTTVLVGGLATDYCVKVSVLQLLKAGFRVILNLDACRGLDPFTTQQALEDMQAAGAEIIYSSTELQLLEPEQVVVNNKNVIYK
jgi:nicotinamidase/pyrazinamidase